MFALIPMIAITGLSAGLGLRPRRQGNTQLRFQTCGAQSSCIDWSMVRSRTADCDASTYDCTVEVCATLNFARSGCSKSGSISHTCVKDEDECSQTTGSFAGFPTVSDSERVWVPPVPDWQAWGHSAVSV
jgi:hypothetical protein